VLRSIFAVVVGFLIIGALSMGTAQVLQQNMPAAFGPGGRVDSVGLLLFMQGCVAVYAICGCWLAARLAPNRPMTHALVLGALGLVFNIIGVATRWDTAPAWYQILALALVMPYAWLGGRLREQQLARAAGAAAAPSAPADAA
jgi:hypothetical protein